MKNALVLTKLRSGAAITPPTARDLPGKDLRPRRNDND